MGHAVSRLVAPVDLVEPRDAENRATGVAGRRAQTGADMRIKISLAMVIAAAAIAVTQAHWLSLA